jgi:hypothetical protein
MNYQKIYNDLVERGKTRTLAGYKERHHIVPKCMGGNDSKSNLVYLTAREHFIAHWLLVEIYPENTKLQYAFWQMCNSNNPYQNRYTPSSRIYEYAKMLHSNNMHNLNKGKKFGPMSSETKQKISEKLRGKESIKTEQWKRNISEGLKRSYDSGKRKKWNLGKTMSKEYGEKISKAKKGMVGTNKGIPMSEEQKQKIRNTLLGHEVSESTKNKISQTLLNKPILTCPHCNKSSRGTSFKVYHFENCKFKK